MKLATLQPRLKPATTHTPKRNWGKGRGGRPWRRLKDEILARDLYTCQHCGRVGGQLELDHIVNTANGGTDDPSNLQILCHDCHKVKTQAESQGQNLGGGASKKSWQAVCWTPRPSSCIKKF